MSLELEAVIAVAIGVTVAGVATPLMARVGDAIGLLDRPGGYKQHERPTPYLGGVAILIGVVAATLLVEGVASHIPLILLAAAGMCALGTIDDWKPIPPALRLAGHGAIGAAVWAGGAGWDFGAPAWIELVLTVGWVVLAVNTFNLLDNLDGAASSVAAATALGVAVIALATGGAAWAAVVSAALLGACLAFLPFNLARPARVFLGDGGSTVLGFLIAASAMGALNGEPSATVLLAAGLLIGVPALDTALVFISRRRRGVPMLAGGRDHLTHRANSRLGDPRKVALEVSSGQLALSAIAAFAVVLGPLGIVVAAVCYGVAAAGLIAALETNRDASAHTTSPPPSEEGARITVPTAAGEVRRHVGTTT
jgi:UDP-GlcNAc:undecaprenyl-phosphate GlcNAc-1-phosphate transferase